MATREQIEQMKLLVKNKGCAHAEEAVVLLENLYSI